jgi:hypothetical protein
LSKTFADITSEARKAYPIPKARPYIIGKSWKESKFSISKGTIPSKKYNHANVGIGNTNKVISPKI